MGGNGLKSSHDGSKKSSMPLGMFAWYLEKHKPRNTGEIGLPKAKIVQSCHRR